MGGAGLSLMRIQGATLRRILDKCRYSVAPAK